MRRIFVISVMLTLVAAAAMASSTAPPLRPIPPTTVVMEFPADLGPQQRPRVEFEHAVHTKALEEEGCTACHAFNEQNRLVPALKGTLGFEDRSALIDAYHGVCIDCHEQRSTASGRGGPTMCGSCHVKRASGSSTRAAMRYDYSLHARHVAAAEDKCETCHHVWDEAAQRLRYEKGAEEGCRTCHLEHAVDNTPSLQDASHLACVSCHLERAGRGEKAGPVQCVGCHDSAAQALFVRLDEVPRLKRGQPDVTWVHREGASYPAVAFDHQAHENQADFCSDCHHQTLKACDECHTLTGAAEGAGVTLAQAYHGDHTIISCVGCHSVQAADRKCTGCHAAFGPPPAERSCNLCHRGPRTSVELETTEPPSDPVSPLDPLPAFSDVYPETVTIDVLAAEYQPSKLPHAKIVAALDTDVRESDLAVYFHARSATLCTGCHHHSPADAPPPACRTCHAKAADPVTDKPGLKVAYHRQCIGCHIRMNISKQGCTDCHEAKEVQQ